MVVWLGRCGARCMRPANGALPGQVPDVAVAALNLRAGRFRSRRKMVNKHREQGFDLSIANDKLPDYNALFDRNLRHYFENRNVQHHLYRTGLVRADLCHCLVPMHGAAGTAAPWPLHRRWS